MRKLGFVNQKLGKRVSRVRKLERRRLEELRLRPKAGRRERGR